MLFCFLISLISSRKALKQYIPASTFTKSPPWPSERPPRETWPTKGPKWPPTMSPYPTRPGIHTDSSSEDIKTVAIIGITIGTIASVAILCLIVFLVIRFRRTVRLSTHPLLETQDSVRKDI